MNNCILKVCSHNHASYCYDDCDVNGKVFENRRRKQKSSSKEDYFVNPLHRSMMILKAMS